MRDSQVAVNVRAELARSDRTQADLARLLSITPQAISRRMTGDVAFTADELTVIADYLDVPVSRLFDRKETMTQPQISAKQAAQLWLKLKQHFVNAQRVIEEIIAKQAWLPLGYDSFMAAWKATMADVTLAAELRPFVVYQMFAEGWSPDDVSAVIKGLGRDHAERFKKQRDNGVPASGASMTIVSRHNRRKPGPADTIHLFVGSVMLDAYRQTAERVGKTVETISLEAVQERFLELSETVVDEKRPKRRSPAKRQARTRV